MDMSKVFRPPFHDPSLVSGDNLDIVDLSKHSSPRRENADLKNMSSAAVPEGLRREEQEWRARGGPWERAGSKGLTACVCG